MTAAHWDEVYAGKSDDQVSWFEEYPETALEMISDAAITPGAAVDVGAGRSRLSEILLARGWSPVYALDVSAEALAQLADRVNASRGSSGSWSDMSSASNGELLCVNCNVLDWQPDRQVALWHDRAVFHFLIDAADQERYAALASRTVATGGILVLGTFALDGPEQCSGLPTSRHDAASLERAFSPAFTLVQQRRVEHRTPWGAMQPFTWVLLRRR
jgi:hypothetical protein